VATRAGVAESAFGEAFSTVEECYRAAFAEGLDRLSRAVSEATVREQSWLERVRVGLVALLGFFDDEPSWARLLVIETPISAATAAECIRGLHNLLGHLLQRTAAGSDGFPASRPGVSPMLVETLTGELVVGGVFSVIRTNMLEADGRRLVELAPSLMAFIVAPYLGQTAAQAELEGRPSTNDDTTAGNPVPSRETELAGPASLPIRVTHRTTMVLRAIAQAPYSNNREIADAAGLTDEGQTSKLLARLERRGVIENVGIGAARGEPNAWLLTASGQRVLAVIGASASAHPRGTSIRGEA
jgi:AcrR family transcriptional regulator